jgi:hypothetical protein
VNRGIETLFFLGTLRLAKQGLRDSFRLQLVYAPERCRDREYHQD